MSEAIGVLDFSQTRKQVEPVRYSASKISWLYDYSAGHVWRLDRPERAR